MKKVQRILNFHTYKRLFCANCDVIANFYVRIWIQKFFKQIGNCA